MVQQRFDTQALPRIVFDNQKLLASWGRVLADASDRGCQAFGRGRLGDKCESPMRQTVVPVFVQGKHLNRYVAGSWILLQMIQHRPAEHIGQRHIERYSCGMKLLRQRQPVGATKSNEYLESIVS